MFNFIKQFFNKPKKLSYYDFLIEKDNADRKLAQKIEDQKIERKIKSEARRMFHEWYNAPMITIGKKEYKNCLNVMGPVGYIYHIHDEETAKYNGVSINFLVKQEFQKYIEDFKKGK